MSGCEGQLTVHGEGSVSCSDPACLASADLETVIARHRAFAACHGSDPCEICSRTLLRPAVV